ncbi:MAG: polysaccharide pyruvyl transferase family protein, partial [Cyclobacteriaceae bacterium]
FGNLGDDILLMTSWGILLEKFNPSEINVYSNFNSNLSDFDRGHNYNHYIFTLLNHQVELVDWTCHNNVDVVLDGGGGVYFDYRTSGVVRKLINGVLKLIGSKAIYNIDVLIRELIGRPKRITFKRRIGVGLGIGPYSNSSPLLFSHFSDIGSSDIIIVRDRTSFDFLHNYNYRGVKILGTDLAFLNKYWLKEGKRIEHRKFKGNIGIVLMDWHKGSESKFLVFEKFADQLMNENATVTFFSFDENNDSRYIKRFSTMYKFVTWKPNEMSFDEFINQFSKQDVIFSARAHGVIVGSILGIPSVCIGTSDKLVEVSKMFPSVSLIVREPIALDDLQKILERVSAR